MALDHGFSSDSSDDEYYLCDSSNDYNLRRSIRHLLYQNLDGHNIFSSPQDMANFLNQINAKHGFNIPVDIEDIKKKLAKWENSRNNFLNKKNKIFNEVDQEMSTNIAPVSSSAENTNLHFTSPPNQETMFPFLSNTLNPSQESTPYFLNQTSTTSVEISTHQHPQALAFTDQLPIVNINDDHIPPKEVPVPAIREGGDHKAILVFRKKRAHTDSEDHQSWIVEDVSHIGGR